MRAMSKTDKFLRRRTGGRGSLEGSAEFNNTKRKINAVCEGLTLETKGYSPRKTVESINNYIASVNKLDRILYSEISSYIFSLKMSKRGVYTTNLDKLMSYSLKKENKVPDDSRKIIIKIYDHSQLALYQIENVNQVFAEGIEDAKENFQNQIKDVERDYISILGIFAAIVLAFVGGITFSTSVLQNISEVSIYRLLMVVDFLAFTLINIIYLLINCIFKINGKDTEWFKIKELNIACLGIAAVVAVAWMFNADQLSAFISSSLPWNR